MKLFNIMQIYFLCLDFHKVIQNNQLNLNIRKIINKIDSLLVVI